MTSAVTMVTGVGGPAGRAVSQYFLQNSISVLGADMRQLDEPSNFRLLPPAHEEGFFLELERLLDEAAIRFLVPTVTEELPKVAESRDLIRKKNCALFVSPPEAIRIANDKWETVCALMAHGIPVPASYCGDSKAELMAAVSFPALSKPRQGRGGRGVQIHWNNEGLPDVLSRERIYQEFLPADEYDVNLFAELGGKTTTSVVLKKIALKDGVVGNALKVERVIEPEIARLAEAAVLAISLEGPVDVDIRRGSDGRPFILEINARVGANVRAAEEVLIAMIDGWRSRQ